MNIPAREDILRPVLAFVVALISTGVALRWKYFEWAGIYMRTEDPANRDAPVHAYDPAASEWRDSNLTAGVLGALGARELTEKEARERGVTLD